MKIVLLTTDNREPFRQFDKTAPWFGTAPEALLQGFSLLPEHEVHVVSCIRQSVPSPQKLAPNIFFHSLIVPKIGWLRTGYQGCIRAARKKLRQIQPDIVHGQGTERDCALSAVFSGFPNVLTLHGNMRLVARVNHAPPFSFLWLAARLEQITLPFSGGVVCISQYTQQAVSGLAKKTWLLPNAVDSGFFQVQNQPSPSEPPLGLCVGAVCPRKNQNSLILALDSLAAEFPFRLVFLGQTDSTTYSRDFLSLVHSRTWCSHEGFAGREELKTFLGKASFGVLPTLEDNCPMVVLEAMAAGLPMLASNVGGVPDLITPESTGLLADPSRPESFAQGIRRLLTEPGLAARLGAEARQEALRRFHPEIIARRHVEIYREVLAG